MWPKSFPSRSQQAACQAGRQTDREGDRWEDTGSLGPRGPEVPGDKERSRSFILKTKSLLFHEISGMDAHSPRSLAPLRLFPAPSKFISRAPGNGVSRLCPEHLCLFCQLAHLQMNRIAVKTEPLASLVGSWNKRPAPYPLWRSLPQAGIYPRNKKRQNPCLLWPKSLEGAFSFWSPVRAYSCRSVAIEVWFAYWDPQAFPIVTFLLPPCWASKLRKHRG